MVVVEAKGKVDREFTPLLIYTTSWRRQGQLCLWTPTLLMPAHTQVLFSMCLRGKFEFVTSVVGWVSGWRRNNLIQTDVYPEAIYREKPRKSYVIVPHTRMKIPVSNPANPPLVQTLQQARRYAMGLWSAEKYILMRLKGILKWYKDCNISY